MVNAFVPFLRAIFSWYNTRLNNWAKERSKLAERRVREQVVNAARTDLEIKSDPGDLKRIRIYQARVDRMLHIIISKLKEHYPNSAHSTISDSETGKLFSIHIRHDLQNERWIAEEINPDGNPISRSTIFDNSS